ncbi:MAG: Gfo/Idh/MocA family oxidoreductase [Oscillospiraceae bacterium]|nr:Gfo/Idh/MocA family oxidoreductase [Oscillospiraceae bacterium]
MKTVITFGVFDLYHEGHAKLLERAKALGDRLIVGVTTDQYAYQRGKFCTVDPLEKRMEAVRACPYVDQVIVEDHDGQKVEDILRYRADIFAIGDDWLGKFDFLESLCQVVYLPRTPEVSSSLLRFRKYPYLPMGLIGCGRIAERFLREVGYVREIQVPCVYHPRPDSSLSLQRFLAAHTGIAKVRTLEKLFDQTEAVYIASPHETHYTYAKAALDAGKHVLCEKPLAFSRVEAEELFLLAQRKGLVLMEAIKTAYCPGFVRLCSLVKSGLIGKVVEVNSCFTRLTPQGCREWNDLRYGGSFTEFGSYVMLPIVKLLGTKDLEFTFRSVRAESGLDSFTRLDVACGDMMASGRCGLGAKSEGQLIITGTQGYALVEAPWWKTQSFELRYEDPQRRKRFSADFEGDGLRYEIGDFMYRVQGHPGREFKLTPEESVCMAGIFEAFLQQR